MKALALISGGLDSILAARLIKEQGIEVVPVNFKIPFCHLDKGGDKITSMVFSALGVELKKIDISDDFLRMLQNPRYGFGSNMNPCIDCKILMLNKARGFMPEFGADFVVTGEVLGQRPMSQHKQALDLIPRRAGLEGLVLRPLSARVLAESIPEEKGWVNREGLLNFGGRGRKPQFKLAEKFNIKDYAQPSGGCLLTDFQFSSRLKDLMAHKELSQQNITLLKIARHFRMSPKAKLIVGRDESENKILEGSAVNGDCLVYPKDNLAGPTALLRGEFGQDLIDLSSRITAHYCDLNGSKDAAIFYRQPGVEESCLKVAPIEEESLKSLRI